MHDLPEPLREAALHGHIPGDNPLPRLRHPGGQGDRVADDRVVVPDSVTIEYLTGLFDEERTSAQANRLLEPFLGKWIRVSGRIHDVQEVGSNIVVSFYDHGQWLFTFMEFDGSWVAHLSVKQKGDDIDVLGKIGRVSPNDLHLRDCELV